MDLTVEVDPSGLCVYIPLTQEDVKTSVTEELHGWTIIKDYDARNNVVGVELIPPQEWIDLD